MKKLITILLAACLMAGAAFTFASCGAKEDKLICGVTEFDPMNYLDADGNWTGFDTEFALLVGQKIGLEVEFQKIEWSSKYTELKSGAINAIWNGFTANSVEKDDGKARSAKVDFSYSYMINTQCAVVKADKAGEYKTAADFASKTIAAESGSSGESVANTIVGGGKVVAAGSQTSALTEVLSGASDCAVVDITLAAELLSKGGDFAKLKILSIDLGADTEYYAVGFKKGSSLTKKVNDAIKELYDDGSLLTLAKKYNLENALILNTDVKGFTAVD